MARVGRVTVVQRELLARGHPDRGADPEERAGVREVRDPEHEPRTDPEELPIAREHHDAPCGAHEVEQRGQDERRPEALQRHRT